MAADLAGHVKVVVIGASTGGIQALQALFSALPAEFPAVMAVVVHRSPRHDSRLAYVLQRSARMPIIEPDAPVPPSPGHVYLAPRDHHLLMRDRYIEPIRGPKENFTRPAVDPLFRSAAAVYGDRVIGVVLSGWGSDGVAGLIAIKRANGVSMVQHPSDAPARGMPVNALVRDNVDWVLPVSEMSSVLLRLVNGEAVERHPAIPGV
jgi:two-component system chemotaxis response regulator CheB